MNEPKTYSASDIERYHRGEMTAAEMHLLEKAALDDPMLADALEGYAGTKSASADLRLLQERLQKRVETSSRGKLLFFGSNWLKVAAVFLLFAGGGWLVFQAFDKKNTLAKNPAVETLRVDKNSLAQKPQPDSTTLNFSTGADSSEHSQDVAVAETKAPVFKRKAPTAVTALQSEEKNDVTQDKETEVKTMSGVLAKAEGRTENADTNRMALNNQAANVTVRTLNDSTKQMNVVLKRLGSPVDEVVISKAKAQPRTRSIPVTVDSLEPEQGWASFDDYVVQNLKAPEDLKIKYSYNKEVELSFDVDGEGNPTNVKVTKSLCEKCDAEAIRILKEGPKWKGKKTKGKIKIKFPLSP